MQSVLSRRLALTSLCAAVAIPVTAYAAPPTADAELIALGKEMDRLFVVMADAEKRAEPFNAAMSRELEALKRAGATTNAEYEAAFARADAQCHVAFPTHDDVCDMMADPSRRIMALPAVTMAGLAVKAQLYRSNFKDIWEVPADSLDWDDKIAKSLVDAVLRLAAVQS